MSSNALVVAEDLHVTYRLTAGIHGARLVHAVQGVDIDVRRGELFAVVGESGSGKSTLGRTLVRLLKPTSGRVFFDGNDVGSLRGSALVSYRGEAQIVFQNPYQSLNPRMVVGDALREVLNVWKLRRPDLARQTVEELLEMVQLPAHFARKHPHELSGGERQRVAIARAMAVRPRFLVADEPVSSLDVSAAARIMNLLLELRSAWDLTCLFITHDLGLARAVADRIAVMYLGRVVDSGSAEDVFERPGHDYTRSLLAAQLHVPGPELSGARAAAGQ